jgi:hypothetical protein
MVVRGAVVDDDPAVVADHLDNRAGLRPNPVEVEPAFLRRDDEPGEARRSDLVQHAVRPLDEIQQIGLLGPGRLVLRHVTRRDRRRRDRLRRDRRRRPWRDPRRRGDRRRRRGRRRSRPRRGRARPRRSRQGPRTRRRSGCGRGPDRRSRRRPTRWGLHLGVRAAGRCDDHRHVAGRGSLRGPRPSAPRPARAAIDQAASSAVTPKSTAPRGGLRSRMVRLRWSWSD